MCARSEAMALVAQRSRELKEAADNLREAVEQLQEYAEQASAPPPAVIPPRLREPIPYWPSEALLPAVGG